MAIRVRPLVEADLPVLAAIDAAYSARHGLEEIVSAGALRFFGRTEHSFAAETGGPGESGPVGFLLAQALWSGDRPQVLVARVATADRPEAGAALLRALVKSAYDAGVYDLTARAPRSDEALARLLDEEGFGPDAQLSFVRVLGSRGAQAAQAADHG